MKAGLLLMLPLMLLTAGDEFAEGVRAYREGRYQDALDAFTAAEAAAGDEASPTLLYNLALAALQTGQFRLLEYTVEKAAARGGTEFAELRDFMLGSSAFARCETATAEATLADPDPTALSRATTDCQIALEFWRKAAARRDDWPEARRNVERALRQLEKLQQMLAEAEERAKKEQAPTDPEEEADPQDEDPDKDEEVPDAQQEPGQLSRDDLLQVLNRLAQTELEKRSLRRARQRIRTDVERDW